MTPADLIDLAKRSAAIGVPGNNSDQTAVDLLKHLNLRMNAVWRFHSWDYSIDDISLSVSSTDYEKTLPSTTGDIEVLGVSGLTGRLKRYSLTDYMEWERSAGSDDTGSIKGYIHIGRDSSKNIKIRFFPAPTETTTVIGWGKKRLNEITSADLATEIPYFPTEAQDVIYTLLLSDAYRLAKDLRADERERTGMAMMRMLKGEVESEADLEMQSPPPDYVRFVNRRRGRGTGVY